MKSESCIERVLPKACSVLLLTAMLLSSLVNVNAEIFIFGANGKIVKRVEVEAALTGNAIGGLTPTGLMNSSYFPDSTNNFVYDETTINNLNLPATVTELPYFLNNTASSRGFLFREGSNWSGNILSFGASRRIPVGATVQFKNGTDTVLAGTFARPIRNYESFDTALDGRFTIPATPATEDSFGLAEVKFFAADNTLHIEAAVSGLSQACTQITLNEGAEGTNGSVISNLPITAGQETSGFYCTGAKTVALTAQQVSSLRNGRLYIVAVSAGSPNGVRRGQLDLSSIDADFSGDGRTDIAVYRPSDQKWYIQDSSTSQVSIVGLGTATSKVVAADYDGDSKTDLALYEPSSGIWTVRKSSTNTTYGIQWGISEDIPLSGKHFGTADDIVVFRPSTGTWYIKRAGDIIKPIASDAVNNNLNYEIFRWGKAGDKPLMADFNGDGRDEIAVFRPSDGTWYILNQKTGSYKIIQFGTSGDIPVAADYDNDGKADIAVFRPSNGTWYIVGSAEQNVIITRFGVDGDIPVVGDYDKDGVADIAVFRPSNGTWYRLDSSTNKFSARRFGLAEDIPAVR